MPKYSLESWLASGCSKHSELRTVFRRVGLHSTQDTPMCVTSLAGPENLRREKKGHPSISSQARHAFQSLKQDQSGLLWTWLHSEFYTSQTTPWDISHIPSKARGILGICQLTPCSSFLVSPFSFSFFNLTLLAH